MEDWPVEIMTDILLRLPVKTIIYCKCVCKKWLNIVSDSYFVGLHLLRSSSGFMIHHKSEKVINRYSNPGILKWVEIEDELNHHHLHHDPVMSLDLNLAPIFQNSIIRPVGSVNGFICLWQYFHKIQNYFICNPVTREYMILSWQHDYRDPNTLVDHSFGISSVTKEYKVVQIIKTSTSRPYWIDEYISLLEAEVYTLGTGQWRSLGHLPFWIEENYGPFLNGHAHWTIADKDSPEKICAFSFDKEAFELFPSPPEEDIEESQVHSRTLGVLQGCLCRCDTCDSHFTIWVMKEYGIKTSWFKELIINKGISRDLGRVQMWDPVHLIERLRDGTILMVYYREKLLAYSSERRTTEDTVIFHRDFFGVAYRPSFLKLQNFKSESVHLF